MAVLLETVLDDETFAREMLVGAERYYLGRHTIAAAFFPRDLTRLLVYIDRGTRYIIARDILQHLTDVGNVDDYGGCNDLQPWRELCRELLTGLGAWDDPYIAPIAPGDVFSMPSVRELVDGEPLVFDPPRNPYGRYPRHERNDGMDK